MIVNKTIINKYDILIVICAMTIPFVFAAVDKISDMFCITSNISISISLYSISLILFCISVLFVMSFIASKPIQKKLEETNNYIVSKNFVTLSGAIGTAGFAIYLIVIATNNII